MHKIKSTSFRGFPGGSVVKNPPAGRVGGRHKRGGDMGIYVYV